MEHGPVGHGYRVCQLDVSVDAIVLRNKVLYEPNEDIKAAVMERFNRTLKEKNVSLFYREKHTQIRRRSVGSHMHTITVIIDR